MKKKIIYLFILLLSSLFTINAQNNNQAEQIISSVLLSAKNNAIRSNFTLIISDKSNPSGQTTTGVFTLKGNKFVLEMDAMKAWFDGKTQWSYIPQNNEVSITEPTEKEISETNPMAILSGYKNKCSIRFSMIKSLQNYVIDMIPTVKGSDILKIEVQVNKTTENLFSIKLTDKKGSTSLLTLSNFQKNIKVSDSFFVFNSSKHKGVTENDLR